MTNALRINFASWLALAIIAGLFCAAALGAESNALTITTTEPVATDTRLEVSYEIRNISEHEVWICDDMAFEHPQRCERCLSEDNQFVTLRRRLDVPMRGVFSGPPRGRYVRLRAGEKCHESLSVDVPLDADYAFTPTTSRQTPKNLFYVSRLAIEIGYWVGNLPEILLNRIEEAEKTYDKTIGTTPPILAAFGGALSFNYSRERLRNREEEIVIPYMYQRLKGERVLRVTVDELCIPCRERHEPGEQEIQKYYRPNCGSDGTPCTIIELRCKPSALEYLFPSAVNQSLLSPEEIGYLQSERGFLVQDQDAIQSFAKKILYGCPSYGVVREDNIAHFDCYHGNDHLTSFDMCGDVIVTAKDRRWESYEAHLASIGVLVPEIQALEYRVQCAINLRDLYY